MRELFVSESTFLILLCSLRLHYISCCPFDRAPKPGINKTIDQSRRDTSPCHVVVGSRIRLMCSAHRFYSIVFAKRYKLVE